MSPTYLYIPPIFVSRFSGKFSLPTSLKPIEKIFHFTLFYAITHYKPTFVRLFPSILVIIIIARILRKQNTNLN
ncbi:hypothetical protein RJT34_24692 [Clitoria ternatea]|uniref:Uncharacterized protein n=1 Tax=Clitoria ternatea TaxID=43366 RepID=A0AAN9IHR9_CLITE